MTVIGLVIDYERERIVSEHTSVAVIGVVFATVWAGTSHWAHDQSRTALNGSEPSRVVFQNSLGDESAGDVEDSGYAVALARLSEAKDM